MNLKNINYNKIFYYSILSFAFILPLSRAGISFFSIFLPILWLADKNIKTKLQQLKSNKLILAISIYLLFSILSSLWSSNVEQTLNIIRLNSYWILIFVISSSVKKEQVPTIISSFLAGMFVSEILAYGVFFELWHFKYATPQNPSPFMFWIDYSVFMAFTSILLLNRILSKNYDLKQKILFSMFFISVTGNLFLAIGRTGQVAFIAGVFVMMIIHYRLSIKSLFLSFILLGTIFTTAYQLSNSFKIRVNAGINDIKQIKNMDLNGSWGIRVAYWITTFDIVKEQPILGVGIGDFKDETAKVLTNQNYNYLTKETKEFMKINHPHNQYLLVLLQMGIIGIFIFLYLIYQILKLDIKEKEIKELSILFTTIFFVSCFAEPLFLKQFTISLFMLFIGLFIASSNKENAIIA